MTNPHFQRGVLHYQQQRYEEAVGEFQLALADSAEDSQTHGFLALALNELEKYPEATEHAHRAIHLAPDEAFGHYALARVMMGRQRYDEAHAAILEAIRLDSYDPHYFGIVANLELIKGRWREALAAANKGLEIDPEHNLCTNMRAQALVNLGDRAGAAATMGEALARRPDDALTHANQGWALLHAGDPYKALEHFRESLRLDPELEWSQAGIVEALKARNFVYRWMLAWFLWMSRLTPGTRWALIIGAMFGQRFIRQLANNSPDLAPFLWPLLYAYMAFVLMTWLSPSFFNLLLRLDRFGRYALSADQIRGANVLATCLVVTIGLLIGYLVTGSEGLLVCTIFFGVLSLPASAIYACEPGWPRQAMAAITLGLLAAVLFVVAVVEVLPAVAITFQAAPLAELSVTLMPLADVVIKALPLALVASQFAAMYLTQVTPRK